MHILNLYAMGLCETFRPYFYSIHVIYYIMYTCIWYYIPIIPPLINVYIKTQILLVIRITHFPM